MTISEIMKTEHHYILQLTEAIDKKVDLYNNSNTILPEFFIETLDFIRNFADDFHHAKEENILFRELLENKITKDNKQIDRFQHQHSMGRRFMKNLEEAIFHSDHLAMIKNIKEYSDMIKAHIETEDNVVFPLYEKIIPEELKDQIIAKFKEMENERFPPEFLERYKLKLLNIRKMVKLDD